MAGYSGTPLARKLGIKAGHNVGLISAPDEMRHLLGDLPDGVQIRDSLRTRAPFDVLLFFTTSAATLEKRFAPLAQRLVSNGGLWVAWPKKASGLKSDLTGDTVRAIGLKSGLVDNKVCAIDETWSGLRFVIRLKDRA